MFDFDKIIDRHGTDCVKYDGVENEFGCTDVLPMWVADMDFQVPPAVMDAVRECCDRGIYGYTFRSEEGKEAFCDWVGSRYAWRVEKAWLSSSPGVVTALAIAVRALTEPGDKVLIMTPVYPPFFDVVRGNGRTLVQVPLLREDGRYVMDLGHVEEAFRDGVKMLILCNSHNPVGRVWTREELARLGELCCRYGVTIVSDEIHADLALPGYCHTPMAAVSGRVRQRGVFR